MAAACDLWRSGEPYAEVDLEWEPRFRSALPLSCRSAEGALLRGGLPGACRSMLCVIFDMRVA